MVASGRGRRSPKTDAELVEEAKRDLLDQLRDPYYWEALQVLKREGHPLLLGVVGGKNRQIGDLARRFQRGDAPVRAQAKVRGRPRSVRNQALFHRRVADAFIKAKFVRTYREAAMHLARVISPLAKGHALIKLAEKIKTRMYDAGKYLKKSV